MPFATWPRAKLEKPMKMYDRRVLPSPLRKLLTRNVNWVRSVTNTLARPDRSGLLDVFSSMSHHPFVRLAVPARQERGGGTAAHLSHELCRRLHRYLSRKSSTAVLRESA